MPNLINTPLWKNRAMNLHIYTRLSVKMFQKTNGDLKKKLFFKNIEPSGRDFMT